MQQQVSRLSWCRHGDLGRSTQGMDAFLQRGMSIRR